MEAPREAGGAGVGVPLPLPLAVGVPFAAISPSGCTGRGAASSAGGIESAIVDYDSRHVLSMCCECCSASM